MAHPWDAFLDLAALQGLTNVDETKVTAESDKPTDASRNAFVLDIVLLLVIIFVAIDVLRLLN